MGPDRRVRGKQFEHVCKWFLTNDPLYKQRLRHVWLWKEWPDRPGDVEAGIDLVAEDSDGRLWAVQAKAYAEDNPIPKAELNKFLSESNTKQFSQRLLISTTTGGLHQLAQRAVEAQEKPVTALDLADLRAADAYLDWPESPDKLRPSRPPKPATPHDYQRDAIRDVVKGFKIFDRGQLIMACGTGKTLTSLFIKEKLGAERVLVLVPSLSLLKQTLRVWMVNRRNDFDILPVCSDATVSRDEDAIVAHTSDLGVPVTTDPEDIARFLRRRGPRVVFATYQSSPQVAAAFAGGRIPTFDLVLADEAHRCAGPVSSDFATVLDGSHIKARRRLFMTATPRYFTGRVLKAAQEAEYEYASMDDEATFGPVFHKLGFGAAIERGLLTDYQVSIVGVDDATYREWAEKGTLVRIEGNKVTDAATLAGQIGLAKAMRKYGLRRTISFHSRVKRAREFAATLPEVVAWMPARQRPKGKPWCAYTSGEMNAGVRGRLIQQLGAIGDGEYGLLTNARCLAEGVDVPTLDGVAFIDPRRSEVDIVQAVGRAIRKSDEKKVGTIVIPVFVDTEADPEVALDSSVFKPVWDVVRALRAHDEELGRQLDDLRRELGRKGGRPRLPVKIHNDLPVTVGTAFARAFDVRLVEQTTLPWDFWFGLLDKYVAENGTSRVPFAAIVRGYKLGQWINAQRNAYVAGVLSPERTRRLGGLPGWTWNARLDLWEDAYDALCRYVDEFGDARVQYQCVYEGFNLGIWVTTQRRAYAIGKLGRERQERLLQLPGWMWDVKEEQWEEGFHHLVAFVERTGTARMPVKYIDESGFALGAWAISQRQLGNRGDLDAARVKRLEALAGWSWHTKNDAWDEKFSLLMEYASEHGNANVPSAYVFKGVALGSWAAVQRSAAAAGRLETDRYRRLDSLPGWVWHTFDARWEESFGKLLKYVEREGTSFVPQSYKLDGYALGGWVSLQRMKRAAGELSEDRQRRLEALPGWMWDVKGEQWEAAFALLQRYAKAEGNPDVPGGRVFEGYKLGDWVERQRREYAKGNLSTDRVRRLEAVKGWQWNPKTDQWARGFSELLTFVAERGHALVPGAYKVGSYRLGGWVLTQRVAFGDGTIDPERTRRLEAVPGWTWNPHVDSWERAFRLLEQYAEANGNTRVPDSYRVEDFGLGAWVGIQRGAHRQGKLTAERIRRLESLPGWVWDHRAANWEEGMEKLVDFVRDQGHCRVPQRIPFNGYPLGTWVARQRRDYARGSLDLERQRRLEEVPGWTWKPHVDSWERAFQLVEKYAREHGHARVPDEYSAEGFRLGSWVGIQRAAYRNGTLAAEREQRLHQLPGWVWQAK